MAETLRRVLSGGGAVATTQPGSPVLLLGAPGSGKTSLMFAAALDAAGEGQGPVLFLTRRPLQRLPPCTRSARDPLRLQKVRFQYPPSTLELLRLLASTHEAPGPAPCLLLLDGLEEYLAEDPGTQEAAYLAALLLDTAAYYSHRLGCSRSCGLMVALETQVEADGGNAPQLTLLQRYFPAKCWLQAEAPGLGQPGCLRARLDSGQPGPRAEWTLKFLSDGEMMITPWPTHTTCCTPDKKSLTAGEQSLTSVCDSVSGPQFPWAGMLAAETSAYSET